MRNDASTDASATGALRAARDLLLAHRADYAAAVAGFSWPRLDEFNWALDWFDVIAAKHPGRLALRVVGDDGSDETVSYAAMAARSAQVANWLSSSRPRSPARSTTACSPTVPTGTGMRTR